MKFNEKYVVAEGYEHLFDFAEDDQIELDALWMAAQFLSTIQNEMETQGINRKELAAKIGTSASWLTQLFRGDKIPNFETIVKLQNALSIEFDIKPKYEVVAVSYQGQEPEPVKTLSKHQPFKGYWKELSYGGEVNYDQGDEVWEEPSPKKNILNYTAA